ncbi:helix-turn-helix domain-containing protein [Sulfitobacter sp. 1A15299]|uniref:helix-turn-helix domain-containing protein n=1 Tax=Sulfitobacter sp. 1A15299 TaxID=3368598 RepID=UPI003747492B
MPTSSLSELRNARAFIPRMEARTRDLHTLKPLKFRPLSGAIADVWHVSGKRGGGGYYIAPDPRLVVFLDDVPPSIQLRTSEEGADGTGLRAFFVPAGVPLWSKLAKAQRLSHIDFHFDAAALQARLSASGLSSLPRCPIFAGDDSILLTLARLAAREVEAPQRGTLVLDGLLQALLGAVVAPPLDTAAPASGGLTPQLMSAVQRHMAKNIFRAVSVAELAHVAGLSESWFGRTFKQTTGMSPQRWIAECRVVAAKEMMADQQRPLADIAVATGFSDQSHLSRVFRRSVGLSPSQWRRQTQ